MRPEMPTLSQVDLLPALLTHRPPMEWQDINGHVNVQHYVHLYDLAGYPLLESLGIDAEFVRVRRRGLFDLEHHVWYLRELHVGDEVTVHCYLLARSVKRLHGVMFLANRSRQQVASALEFLSTVADLDARSTAPIPPDIAMRVDARIEHDRRVGWPAPTCGAMGV